MPNRGKKNKSLKFKTMDNIKGSKEYKLAKEWEMAVNSYAFNPARFAAVTSAPISPAISPAMCETSMEWTSTF